MDSARIEWIIERYPGAHDHDFKVPHEEMVNALRNEYEDEDWDHEDLAAHWVERHFGESFDYDKARLSDFLTRQHFNDTLLPNPEPAEDGRIDRLAFTNSGVSRLALPALGTAGMLLAVHAGQRIFRHLRSK